MGREEGGIYRGEDLEWFVRRVAGFCRVEGPFSKDMGVE